MTDYDRTAIPAAYDRGRDHGPEVLMLWMDTVAAQLTTPPGIIVDLGCGTARFSDALAVHFGAHVVAVDPSFRMIEQAVRKPRRGTVHFQLSRAEALPIASGSVDAVFMSMSLHHFSNAEDAAAECRRVLRTGGTLLVRTGTRDRIATYPYYPFFPASHAILEEVLPDVATIKQLFEAAGFRTISIDLVSQTIAPSWREYSDKLAANADSVLARLSPTDFNAGLAAVRRYAENEHTPVVEQIDFLVFRA